MQGLHGRTRLRYKDVMLPDFGTGLPLYLLLLIPLLLLAGLLRRVPVLGRLLSMVSWCGLGLLLVAAVSQHERFNPYLGQWARALNLDRQQVSGRELRVRMSGDGHFWVRAKVDGVERRMLIDSGATVTALSTRTAAQAGLEPGDDIVPVVLQTANGRVRAQTATVDELSLGNIVARDLSVVVSPSFGDLDVLGMNFLSRLKSWRVEGDTLILVPHHPQATDKA